MIDVSAMSELDAELRGLHGPTQPVTGLTWIDHPRSSSVFLNLPDGTMHHLSVHCPGRYADVWTAEASLLDSDFQQLKYSGLLNGGDTRESAKAAALIAQGMI